MKNFFLNSLFYRIILNLAIKPAFVLGIDLAVQNRVGHQQYGMYFSMYNLTLIFSILLDFGITNFNNRHIAMYRFLLSKYLGSIIIARLILGLLYSIILIIVAILFKYPANQYPLLMVMILNQFLLQFILYIRSNLSAQLLFTKDTFLSVLDRILLILMLGSLLIANIPFGIAWYIYAHSIAYIITLITAILLLKPYLSKIVFRFNAARIAVILKQSFPFAVLVFFMAIYNRFDGFIIERILPNGKEQAGIYAQCYRLLDSWNMISILFVSILYPVFANSLKNNAIIINLFKISGILLLIPSLVLSIGIAFYAKTILQLLYTHYTETTVVTLQIIILSGVPTAISYLYGTYLTAAGKLKILNKIAAFALLFNIPATLLFIQWFGVPGAALATVLTHILVAVPEFYVTAKTLKLKINLIQTVKIILLICILIFAALIFYVILGNNSSALLAYLLVAILSILLLKIISPQMIKLFLTHYFTAK